MGDPKFSTPKFQGPSHPWQGERIKEEKELVKKYGLKNKKELWKAQSVLRDFRQIARSLQARLRTKDPQAEKEKEEFMARLFRMGLLSTEADINDVLALQLEAVLNRRLQTIVHLKGLAYSPKQARQFITHGHISLDGRKVTIPGYFVKRTEEEGIEYRTRSPLSDELHPMRPKPEMERELEKAEASVEAMEQAKEEEKAEAGKEGEKKEEKTEEKAEAGKEGEKKEAAVEEKAPKDLNVAPGGDG